MALTTKTLHRLQAKEFNVLYDHSSAIYAEMAHKALDYVRKRATTEKVLLGDVAEVLKGAVEIEPSFEAFLDQNKLSEGSWALDFADYILEKVFPQPELVPIVLRPKR